MTWTDFYLVCFLVGFLLSAVSFLFGSAHLHFGGTGTERLEEVLKTALPGARVARS